jgi:hypothetical protein
MSQLFRNVSRTIRKGWFTALAGATMVGLLMSPSGTRAAGCGEPFKAKSGPVLSWMEIKARANRTSLPRS